MDNANVEAEDYMALSALTKRRVHKSYRQFMTEERYLSLEARGMVYRDGKRWKLTALGLMYASIIVG